MKTSNKILLIAIGITLFYITKTTFSLHIKYHQTKAYPQMLLKQLADTKIRTLIVDSCYVTISSTDFDFDLQQDNEPIQYISFAEIPTQEKAVIQGDTLRVKNQHHIFVQLQDLENYIADGVPQIIPKKK